MSPEIAALRSNRAVVLSVIVAATAVTALALIGILKMLGWVPARPAISTPMSMAAPANQVAGSAPDLGLAPGETLVVPADKSGPPAPLMPHYTQPTPPKPAPATPAEQASAAPPQAGKPSERARARPRVEPRTPSFVRGDPHPTSPLDTWPNPGPCAHCGRVVATTTWPDIAEVRVQFEDGSVRTLRSPAPSPWHVGDRVRLERGRLMHE